MKASAQRKCTVLSMNFVKKFLLENLKVLVPKNWQMATDGEVDIQYGDNYIRELCLQLHLDERGVIRGFYRH